MYHSRDVEHGTKTTDRAQSRHIILLDDEKTVRDALSRLLKSKGHHCTTAPTGEVLLEIIEHSPDTGATHDLVILDIKIAGGMGGIETMQRLSETNCNIPVISMSGYPVETLFDEGEREGFVGHLEKPFSAQQLSAEIDRVFSSSPPKGSTQNT